MNPVELKNRVQKLSYAGLKIALVLPQKQALSNLIRLEIIKMASQMAIQAMGLYQGQLSHTFLDNLNEAKNQANGFLYWLQLVQSEKMLDSKIIDPLIAETEQIIQMYIKAFKTLKNKLD
ncbi:MAG: hypothetical protein CNE98_03585 [Bacteroidetes bacterium MED-G17]|mgnify:CR=1 FL=1|nr:MAG: hypothetical protein CNE98_03585 [Bacteroidetes bacterium MED-G17]CAI8325177.1 MAG: Uncharacterised protein [Bacteroidetes bacterium MED-G17]|tara:strand:+ start:6193 stop:6552 length:360 start_codon:yes stop_codon:yes gene_type:complete